MSKTCNDCGYQYDTVYKVTDHIWGLIGGPGAGPGDVWMCIDCVSARARSKGMTLYFDAEPGWWREDGETLRNRIKELESVVADLRRARDEAWDEQERLRTCIAELEAERDRLRTALYGVRAIIMSVPVNLGKRWPLRDEILYQIDPALAHTDTEDE